MKDKSIELLGELIGWTITRFTKLVDGFIWVIPYCFLASFLLFLLIIGTGAITLSYDYCHNFKHK
jgi:uncharacterized membrane protein